MDPDRPASQLERKKVQAENPNHDELTRLLDFSFPFAAGRGGNPCLFIITILAAPAFNAGEIFFCLQLLNSEMEKIIIKFKD